MASLPASAYAIITREHKFTYLYFQYRLVQAKSLPLTLDASMVICEPTHRDRRELDAELGSPSPEKDEKEPSVVLCEEATDKDSVYVVDPVAERRSVQFFPGINTDL